MSETIINTPPPLPSHIKAIVEAQKAALDASTAMYEHWTQEPVDIFNSFPPAPLPKNVLPSFLEDCAMQQGELMGADPAGIAMAGLTVLGAIISDQIVLKVKRYDTWTESARLWCALVGDPSTKKSPVMSSMTVPLQTVEAFNHRMWSAAMKAYNEECASDKDFKKTNPAPKCARIMVNDITPEAAQTVLDGNNNGIITVRDELGGWFGAMDKYAGGNSSMADRGFWLTGYNGGAYHVDRVGRGSIYIENLGISLLGGIQPDPLSKIVKDSNDDGLIQRLCPIILRDGGADTDAPTGDGYRQYTQIAGWMFQGARPGNVEGFANDAPRAMIEFDHEAQKIEREVAAKILELQAVKQINKRMASHIGKYAGIFARLSLILHITEHFATGGTDDPIPQFVNVSTARRAYDLLFKFLFPHSLAFYTGVLQMADDHDDMTEVAEIILVHGMNIVTVRDIQQKLRRLKLSKEAAIQAMSQLAALGWVEEVPGSYKGSVHWNVNPACHRLFKERAEIERSNREKAKIAIEAARKMARGTA